MLFFTDCLENVMRGLLMSRRKERDLLPTLDVADNIYNLAYLPDTRTSRRISTKQNTIAFTSKWNMRILSAASSTCRR